MKREKVIGIVGGVGPYASLYTMQKVFDNTLVHSEQEHLPVILISKPDQIEDRSAFLLGTSNVNPAYSILSIIEELEDAGAGLIGLPCNTAHGSRIMSVIKEEIEKRFKDLKLLDMIDEVIRYIKENFPEAKKIAVLTTNGMYYNGEYRRRMIQNGLEVVLPNEKSQQSLLHDSIYNPVYGIKATGNQVSDEVMKKVTTCMDEMIELHADVIVLACTELPLVMKEKKYCGKPILDSAEILARALVREYDEQKLIR
jgi:aspartate racemase